MTAEELAELAGNLQAEMAQDETLLLSSEAFASAGSARFQPLFEAFDVSTVVYLREHIDYLKSWWGFDVGKQTKTISLSDFAWLSRNLSYEDAINGWPDPHLISYDSKEFVGGSVVDDFLTRFAPDALALAQDVDFLARRNPSVKGNLLYLKLRANVAIPDRHVAQTAKEMELLAVERGLLDRAPDLNPDFESFLWAHFSRDREFLSRRGVCFSRASHQNSSSFPDLQNLQQDYHEILDIAERKGMVLERYFSAISHLVNIVLKEKKLGG